MTDLELAEKPEPAPWCGFAEDCHEPQSCPDGGCELVCVRRRNHPPRTHSIMKEHEGR